MLAYRDNGRLESGHRLKADLQRAVERVACDNTGDCALEALLRAGELEGALADAQHPSENSVARVTDAMAACVLLGRDNDRHAQDAAPLDALEVPRRVRADAPEGYAYSALDPRAYDGLIDQLGPIDSNVFVIGVRSIGTSLGAIVSEGLRARVFGADEHSWPASWTQLERIKALSEDGRALDKFEGLPPYCDAAIARAWALEQAGFGPALQRARRGFVRFSWVAGRAAQSGDLDPAVLAELARYCAFRLRTFGVASADPAPIAEMLRVNIEETFGVDVGDQIPIAIEAPIIPDARMQPHEWCFSRQGRLIKFDGHGHGDGQLLPGPTDVCWDLAGAIVEWDMDDDQRDALVSRFERLAGIRVRSRLDSYLVAYAALRIGEMSLALPGARDGEATRIAFERARYGRRLERLLQARGLLC
jgi:hypothetical protein